MRLKIGFVGVLLIPVVGLIGLLLYQENNLDASDVVGVPSPTEQRQTALAYLHPVSQPTYIPIRDFNVANPISDAKAAVVYDISSKRFLYSKNANDQMPIASITKIMTAVIVIEQMDLEKIYTVSVEDLNLDGYGADLYRNEEIRGDELMKMMLIESSNDASAVFLSAALDEQIDLLDEMNKKADDLAMYNTYYNDPAGLDDSRTFSSAADQVKLFRYVTLNHPEIWRILRTQSTVVQSADGKITHILDNTNKLLGVVPGIIGGKTGLTDGAQGTMSIVVSVSENDDVVIAIILGTENRFTVMQELLSWTRKAHSW